jgi:DNA (cytosine-5)-methyltransferase 1
VLLKKWEKLCIRFSLVKNDDPEKKQTYCFVMDDEDDSDDNDDHVDVSKVEKILEICYGDPKKNYGPDYDTWEPISGLMYAIRLLIVLVLFVRCCLISRLPRTL